MDNLEIHYRTQGLSGNDEDIGPLMQWKIDGTRPLRSEIDENSPATRQYWFLWDSLLFYTKCTIHFYLVILGKKKTKEKLSQRFFCFEMREDINIWIQQCEICGAIKSLAKASSAPLDRLATDILGPLPLTPRRNIYILTVTDYFTKWIEVFPIPDQTAATCVHFILSEIYCVDLDVPLLCIQI